MAGGRAQQDAFEKHFLEQAMSLALALDSSTDCNLLPQPLKNAYRMKQAQTLLQWILLGALAILVVITGGLRQSNLARQIGLTQMETRATAIQSRLAAYQGILSKQAALEARINAIRRESGNDETVSDVLKLFSHVVPEKISLLNLEFGEGVQQPQDRKSKDQPDKASGWVVKMQGVNPHPPSDIRIHVAKLMMELEKSGYFSNVECTRETINEQTHEYLFELTGVLKKGRP
jgi:Tfp pilus assembly protein PilN